MDQGTLLDYAEEKRNDVQVQLRLVMLFRCN
jgi:hypothetical protein